MAMNMFFTSSLQPAGCSSLLILMFMESPFRWFKVRCISRTSAYASRTSDGLHPESHRATLVQYRGVKVFKMLRFSSAVRKLWMCLFVYWLDTHQVMCSHDYFSMLPALRIEDPSSKLQYFPSLETRYLRHPFDHIHFW